MRAHHLTLAATVLSAVSACSSSDAPSTAARPAPVATEAPRASKSHTTACDLVTGAEMSAILGGKVVSRNNDHSYGKTECIYTAAEGVSPYAEFSVDWGSGADAMVAASMMNKREPGIADPYQGLGDQAVSVGPTLMIRSGEDLITIVFSGVDDLPTRARKIYDTARARM